LIACSMLLFDIFWYSSNTKHSWSKLWEQSTWLKEDSSVPQRFSPAL
jgi:hypothetical protein